MSNWTQDKRIQERAMTDVIVKHLVSWVEQGGYPREGAILAVLGLSDALAGTQKQLLGRMMGEDTDTAFLSERDRLWREYARTSYEYGTHPSSEAAFSEAAAARAALVAHGADLDGGK